MDVTAKAQATKSNIDTCNRVQVKASAQEAAGTVHRLQNGRKDCKQVSDKSLMSTIYKEL